MIEPYDLDEHLLESTREDDQPHFTIYRHPGTAVVLGRGSDPEKELDLPACLADRVSLTRRRGGGCAVVLDPGNLVVSVTLPLPGLTGISRAYDDLTRWMIEGLALAGVKEIERAGTSDLALGDRKVGGSCIWRTAGLLFYSTTLLVDPRLELIERWLRHPPREPEYRRGRSHREFMLPLSDVMEIDDVGGFQERITQSLLESFPR
ncbi:lipoate--protein ligase family protein [Candidatus Zixiibacteriota bacterium]